MNDENQPKNEKTYLFKAREGLALGRTCVNEQNYTDAKNHFKDAAGYYRSAINDLTQNPSPVVDLHKLREECAYCQDQVREIDTYLTSKHSISIEYEDEKLALNDGLLSDEGLIDVDFSWTDNKAVSNYYYESQDGYLPVEEDVYAELMPNQIKNAGHIIKENIEAFIARGLEKLLDILPRPILKKAAPPPNANNDLYSSFYIMGEPTAPNPITANITKEIDSQKRIVQLENEVEVLKATLDALRKQNDSLLKNVSAYQMQNLMQENCRLKRSILLFRNEVKKQTEQLKMGNSISELQAVNNHTNHITEHAKYLKDLPSLPESNLRDKQRIQQLERILDSLYKTIEEKDSKIAVMTKELDKYKTRWVKLKEGARKRRSDHPERDTSNLSNL